MRSLFCLSGLALLLCGASIPSGTPSAGTHIIHILGFREDQRDIIALNESIPVVRGLPVRFIHPPIPEVKFLSTTWLARLRERVELRLGAVDPDFPLIVAQRTFATQRDRYGFEIVSAPEAAARFRDPQQSLVTAMAAINATGLEYQLLDPAFWYWHPAFRIYTTRFLIQGDTGLFAARWCGPDTPDAYGKTSAVTIGGEFLPWSPLGIVRVAFSPRERTLDIQTNMKLSRTAIEVWRTNLTGLEAFLRENPNTLRKGLLARLKAGWRGPVLWPQVR